MSNGLVENKGTVYGYSFGVLEDSYKVFPWLRKDYERAVGKTDGSI